MSIRTIVEFNNDYLDRLKRDGHISDELFNLLIWGGPDGYMPSIDGVEVITTAHHTSKYEIAFGGYSVPRYRRNDKITDARRHEAVKNDG